MGIMRLSANIIAQVKPSQCLKFNFIDNLSTIPPSSTLEYINFAAATNYMKNVAIAVVLYLYDYD